MAPGFLLHRTCFKAASMHALIRIRHAIYAAPPATALPEHYPLYELSAGCPAGLRLRAETSDLRCSPR
jgi:hypothetical protein